MYRKMYKYLYIFKLGIKFKKFKRSENHTKNSKKFEMTNDINIIVVAYNLASSQPCKETMWGRNIFKIAVQF